MKKIALFAVSLVIITSVSAQEQPPTVKKKKETIDLSGRANDHLMVQIGYSGWTGTPDTINLKNPAKSLNIYFMFDFPFKTSPKVSVGAGLGISNDNIRFEKTYVGIRETSTAMPFRNQADTNHFKKTKLVTTYLEAPIELRYTSKPLESGSSFKFAIGVKAGLLLNAHTRNKTLQNKSGNTINDYVMKEASKRYFNTTRISGIARVGYGHFSLYGSYQLTSLFKEGVAGEIRPFSIGLTISGL
jgi:hypothetical protein